MKIKQKKQVNLTQLINWAWWNRIAGEFQSTNERTSIIFVSGGVLNLHASKGLLDNKVLFEIEEEVTIDENTVLELVAETSLGNLGSNYVFARENESVKDIINESIKHGGTILTLHYVHNDGTMTLIWQDGKMVE